MAKKTFKEMTGLALAGDMDAIQKVAQRKISSLLIKVLAADFPYTAGKILDMLNTPTKQYKVTKHYLVYDEAASRKILMVLAVLNLGTKAFASDKDFKSWFEYDLTAKLSSEESILAMLKEIKVMPPCAA